eukprot:536778-Pelagomonas_calceolata.AAC.1
MLFAHAAHHMLHRFGRKAYCCNPQVISFLKLLVLGAISHCACGCARHACQLHAPKFEALKHQFGGIKSWKKGHSRAPGSAGYHLIWSISP